MRLSRVSIKTIVMCGDACILVGRDAASEGLNLQKIGTLINLDLPWNPTRLEQRLGRIQRVGQLRDEVYLHNMVYRVVLGDAACDDGFPLNPWPPTIAARRPVAG
jgi:superfamily II DNA/RNA helicase